jgi:hypothetical protein
MVVLAWSALQQGELVGLQADMHRAALTLGLLGSACYSVCFSGAVCIGFVCFGHRRCCPAATFVGGSFASEVLSRWVCGAR